jgi:phage terminase large subunit GpA-like protein
LRIGLESRFEIEGGGVATPSVMLIDSGGDRTNEVYEFSRRDPRILPTKGMSRSGVKLFYDTEPKPGVRLWMVDTNHFKGALWHCCTTRTRRSGCRTGTPANSTAWRWPANRW